MTADPSILDQSKNYTGKDSVIVGNGASLPITHTGTLSPVPNIHLLDVLVVPHLTKNLLSISKLTSDFPLSVTFTNNLITIQNRQTGRVVATGKRDGGLYVLDRGNSDFISALRNKSLRASYDLWHARLGHVNHSVISFLNRKGHLSLTSLLPSPSLCNTCQLAKSHRLPYSRNEHRSSHVLDLIHCDLWGPSPVKSNSGFLYYVIFIDDYSRFTWFYPLKFKSDFFDIFLQFQKFVENQYSSRIKVFQSDGGTEFTSTCFKTHLRNSGIHHQLSCPYTPAQNGRAERKHRHVTETGLAWPFSFTLIFLLVFGLTPSALQLTLSTGCLLHFLEVSHPLNSFMATLHIMTIFIPLVVVFILICVIICLTSFLPAAFLVFFWVIVLLIKGSAVLIPPPLSYISPVMLNLMKLTFLLSLAPRPNLFPLFLFQIS